MDSIMETARKGLPLKDVLIIDAHGHMGYWYNMHIPWNDSDGMVVAMDYLGIDKVCVSAHLSIGPDAPAGNDVVAQAIRRHPGRFVGYATVNPNYPEEVALELARCFTELSMTAIKLHASCHNYPTDGPNYAPVWDYASKRGCPVLIHVRDWSNFDNMDKLADEHKDVNFLLAHAGNAIYQDIERVIKLAAGRPNIYLDLTGSALHFGILEYFVETVGAERVIYGSDIPFIDAAPQLGRVVYAKIREDDKRKVLGLNIARLLGISC